MAAAEVAEQVAVVGCDDAAEGRIFGVDFNRKRFFGGKVFDMMPAAAGERFWGSVLDFVFTVKREGEE